MTTLGEIAAAISAELSGDPACNIAGVATIRGAKRGDITFLANPKYRRFLGKTQASAVILTKDMRQAFPGHALIVKDPYLAYARVANMLMPQVAVVPGVHATASVASDCQIAPTAYIGPHAVIEAGATIAAGVYIGPGCVVGRESSIGEGSNLVSNVTICHGVRIGKRALIHAGVVIGADGFGFANDNGSWYKVPQLGSVLIGDDVEVGANTTIDRGALEDTIIEDGVKLDNLIQVAHNVHIGKHTVIAGCTGIAGSAKIGQRCMIGGGVGITGHIEITDNVTITGMSFITQSIDKPGMYSSGWPIEPNTEWRKNYARLRHLDSMARRLNALESAIKKLEQESS